MRSGLATIAPADDVLDAVPGALDLLTEVERVRAARLISVSDRRSFVAAHVLVRLCSAYLFGLPPALTLEQLCGECGGPHGRAIIRELPGAGLSMSHAGGVVAAAVAPGPVGIDVEPLASAVGAADRGVNVAGPAERRELASVADEREALLMLWVRKEALVKLGLATLDGMAELDLSGLPLALPPGGEHRRLRWDRYSIVDLSLVHPAAVGAVVSEGHLDVVTLDELGA